MGWKRKYNTVKIKQRGQTKETGAYNADMAKGKSWLPQFYHGSFDRIARYMQYDNMMYDVDVGLALDTIAEFSTLTDDDTGLPFELVVSEDINSGDVGVLSQLLKKWCRLNNWNSRIFNLFRDTIKFGDQIFIRDPETYELIWVDMYNVSKVLVNEEEGKVPEYYFIKNLSINLEEQVATEESEFLTDVPIYGGVRQSKSITNKQTTYSFSNDSYGTPNSYKEKDKEYPVSSTHIVHVSLSNGTDNLWPFGRSVLDYVFKPFKQKELLEDAIIIYRVQRSPERLLFKIDTGTLPPNKADKYVEEVAKKFRQKRQPVIDTSKGETIMDTSYNPLGMTEDFFFAQGLDGRGSTVEPLPGGECLSLETEIKLLNGETLKLKDIITKFKNNEQLWTYTIDKYSGVICPGMITWAGVTRKDTETVKLHFDDGTSVICTPDHKFPIPDKGYVEAKDIEIGESFFVLNEKIINGKLHYYSRNQRKWYDTEWAFNEFFNDFPLKLRYKDIVGKQNKELEDQELRITKKLTKIEEMPNMDTGTITIDGPEYYTDNHTFPLGNGVFTKNSTGSIEDLKFFSSRLIRGLRVPISYMSYLTEDGQSYQYNDGKVGAAYMEEFKFSKYCERLQKQIIPELNYEFKMYVKSMDIEISASDFDIKFIKPQSFSEYRQIELDTAQLAVFQSVADVPYMSKRFVMKRFMGLSDAEIKKNEEMWKEEQNFRTEVVGPDLTSSDINVPNDDDISEQEQDEEDLSADLDTDQADDEEIDF